MIGKCSSHQRANNGCHTVHTSYKAHVRRSLFQRNGIRDDDQSPGEDTGRAKSGNSSSHNQRRGIRRNTADKGANLEDSNCYQVHPFYTEETVKFSKKKLKGASGEKICRAIPAHIVQGMELIRDLGDGSGNNRVVLNQTSARLLA